MTESPKQQLVDMAENESDPILKELLLGTVAVYIAKEALAETQKIPIGYHPSILYTDKSGIKAMWRYNVLLFCPQTFKTEVEAKNWIDEVLKYWKTPKMAKKVIAESWSIGREFS